MAGVQASGLADLVTTTLNELGEAKFTEIATTLQRHVALRHLMKKERVQLSGGAPNIKFNLMVTTTGNARFNAMYDQDVSNVADVMKTAMVPWRHCTNNYSLDQREIALNSGDRQIVDLLKVRRIDAMIGLSELMENRFWRAPGASDDNPHGVPYWLVKSASVGFTTNLPSGHSDIAGLVPATYPTKWTNYAAPYTTMSKEDGVRAWRKAQTLTDWQPPVDNIPSYAGKTKNYGIYTNYAVYGTLEELLEAQNDNLGNDVASKDGMVRFRRADVEYVSKLDEDTTGVIYGIDWSAVNMCVLRGWWMKETVIENVPGQHTVETVHNDCTFNWVWRNRRTSYVLSTGTTMP